MTDPWADVRGHPLHGGGLVDMNALQACDFESELIVVPKKVIDDALEDLLADADALLAFKDRIQKFDKGAGKEILLAIARVCENSGLPSEDVARRRGMWLRDLSTMIEEALAALPEHLTHEHEWIDPTNEYVSGGAVCLGCGAIRAEAPERLREDPDD